MPPTRADRSLRAYLGAIRRYPGFGLRLMAAMAVATSLALGRGVTDAAVVVVLAVAVALPVGWLRYRRTGRV